MKVVPVGISIFAALYLPACGSQATPTQPGPNGRLIAILGTVHEQSPITDVPIPGVTVEIIEGELTGRSTVTDSNGFFWFDGGTPQSATLRLTKSGYEERRYQIPARSSSAQDIALAALPPTAKLTVRIDNDGSTNALFKLSPVQFDASASEAVRPVFTVDFGDGESTTDAVAVHRCNRQGMLTSRVTVTDAFGRTATATSQFRCIGFIPPQPAGWVERWWSPAGDEPWMFEKCRPPSPAPECSVLRTIEFQSQAGTTLKGRYVYRTYSRTERTQFTAILSGERNIRITLDDGSVTLTGEVLIQDYRLDWGADAEERHLKLIATGGPDDGKLLDFVYKTHDW